MATSYIFNKINFYVVVGIIIIITISINEIALFASRAGERASEQYERFMRSYSQVYRTQEQCQKVTLFVCDYQRCPYGPDDQEFQEACGSGFRQGWQAGAVAIPQEYQRIETIQLTVTLMNSRRLYVISPDAQSVAYGESEALIGPFPSLASRTPPTGSILSLTNRMILYDLINKIRSQTPPPSTQRGTVYELLIKSRQKQTGQSIVPSTWFLDTVATCTELACPLEFMDIRNMIYDMWTRGTAQL